MLYDIFLLVAGLALLTWSADRFIAAAASLVRHWGVSPMLVGVFVLGVGTSAPEIAVSINASLRGVPDIALGNALGSNITNIGLVLAICALLRPLPVLSSALRGEFPAVLGVGVLVLAIVWDGQFARWEGLGLLGLFLLVMGWLAWRSLRGPADDPLLAEIQAHSEPEMALRPALGWLLVGLIGLPLSADIFVQGASGIARSLGVSELVIGLTIVAFGTSLPELAASLGSALRGETEMALGNILGSNLFNALIVFGVPGAIAPGAVDAALLTRDVPVMLAMTVFLYAMSMWRKRIGRLSGTLLLSSFAGYLFILAT